MKFYFNPQYYVFVDHASQAFLEKYSTDLRKPSRVDQEDIWVQVQDLEKILSPEFSFAWDSEQLSIANKAYTVRFFAEKEECLLHGVTCKMRVTPYLTEDGWKIPVCEVMRQAFCFQTIKAAPFFLLGQSEKPLEFTLHMEEHMRGVLRGKAVGELYRTIWNDAVKKLLPYRLYIPTYYGEQKRFPLMIGLHGGMGSPDSIFEKTERKFSYYAERMGFILMAPDACIHNSTYGCCVPPQGCHSDACGFTGDAEELWEKQVSEDALYQEILWVKAHWRVDEKRVFLMGNSMGGIGTFYFASKHPELFCAVSPAGAAPDAELFESEGLKGIPIYLVAGTEDFHGFDHILYAYRVFKEKGLNIQLLPVGGGTHPSAWIDILKETLELLLVEGKNVEKNG